MFARFQNLDSRQLMAAGYVAAATGVVSSCALFALVKFRIVHKILPAFLATKLDNAVNLIAEKTEPKGMTRMSDMQDKVSYLQSVYGQATLGFILGGIGTYLFVRFPRLPVVPAIACTGISFAALLMGPRKLLTPKQRHAAFAATCILGGISLGPMNWIARQTNSVIFAAAMSTTVAFSLTPLITRGWIANAFLSQAVSSSLALLSVKFIALRTFPSMNSTFADPTVPAEDKLVEFITTPIALDGLLMMQAVGNAAVIFLHTAPVLQGARRDFMAFFDDDSTDQLDDVSAQRDALVIVASVSYAVVRLFQTCVEKIARTLKAGGGKDKKAAIASAINVAASDLDPALKQLSGGVSTLTFVFMYVKFVQMVQQSDDPSKSFRLLSKIFSFLTPVKPVSKR